MKKIIIGSVTLIILLILIFAVWIWNANHSIIIVQVIKSNGEEKINLDTIKLDVIKSNGIEPSASVKNDMLIILTYHQLKYDELRTDYTYADVQLKMEYKENLLVYAFTGRVSNIEGQWEPYELTFDIDANTEVVVRNYA